MDFEKYTERARGFIQSAQGLALREGHQQFAPEHLLKVILDDEEGLAAGLISRAGGNPGEALEETEAALSKLPKISGGGAGQTITAGTLIVEGTLHADGQGFAAGAGPGAGTAIGEEGLRKGIAATFDEAEPRGIAEAALGALERLDVLRTAARREAEAVAQAGDGYLARLLDAGETERAAA